MKATSGQKQLGASAASGRASGFQVTPAVVDKWSEQENRGLSMRSAMAITDGRVGSAATAGELWLSMPGRSALTKPLAAVSKRAGSARSPAMARSNPARTMAAPARRVRR